MKTATIDAEKHTSSKVLTFRLATEMYGVNIGLVREIIGILPLTAVPNMPAFIKGVVNLRGKIVPVVDLRLKFGMGAREYDRETCIIIIDLVVNQTRSLIGAVVDSVCEVVRFTDDSIEPSPSFGVKVDTAFLSGIARGQDGCVTLLLDIAKVLTHDEADLVASVVDDPAASAARDVVSERRAKGK